MRSLNNAICTSGEPVSFTCARYCSINIDLASLKSSSPPNPFNSALVLSFSSTVGGYHTRSIPCKIFLREKAFERSCSDGELCPRRLAPSDYGTAETTCHSEARCVPRKSLFFHEFAPERF